MQISGYSHVNIGAAIQRNTTLIQDRELSQKDLDKIDKALSEDFCKRLQEQARKDAKKGAYGSEEAIAMLDSQKRQFISPNRALAIAKATAVMNNAPQRHMQDSAEDISTLLDVLLPNKMSMKANMGWPGASATVYDESGEEIASYNIQGGWSELTTAAENRFVTIAEKIYAKEWDAANAEMKAGQAVMQQPISKSSDSTVDLRV